MKAESELVQFEVHEMGTNIQLQLDKCALLYFLHDQYKDMMIIKQNLLLMNIYFKYFQL